MTANDEYIAEILAGVGLITNQQAEEALAWAEKEGKRFSEVLVGDGVATETDILKALANQFGMEMVSLVAMDIPEDVIHAIPGDVARRYNVVPVYRTDSTIRVAISDPLDLSLIHI